MSPVKSSTVKPFIGDRYSEFKYLYKKGIEDSKELAKSLHCTQSEVEKFIARFNLETLSVEEFDAMFDYERP